MTANHKTNKNSIIVKDEDSLTREIHDNEFVQHSIPRTEFQYSWVSASVKSEHRSDFPYGFFTSSNALEGIQITEGSIHLYDSNSMRVSFTPLKPLYDSLFLNPVVNTETSLLYYGDDFSAIPFDDKKGFTNAYNLMNNGPYNWPTWKQVRSGDSQVVLAQNKESKYYVEDAPTFITVKSALIKEKRSNRNTVYTESPFLTNMRTVEHSVEEIIDERIGLTNTFSYVYDFGNYRIFFSNPELSTNLGFENDLSTFYEDIYHQYNDGFELDVNAFYKIKYSEVVWPRRTSAGLSITRSRPYFILDWKTERSEREIYNTPLKMGKTGVVSSIWPLDGRKLISANADNKHALDVFDNTNLYTTASTSHRGGTGELCGVSQVFHNGDIATLTASACYTYPGVESSSYGVFFTNDSEFRTQRIGGKTPFSNNYEDWDNELRAAAKDYSILPEFRVSEHMDTFLDLNQGNFLADVDIFEVSGSVLSSSAQEEFYQVYQSSDIFKDFKKIRTEHEDFGKPTRLKINVEAVMRFTPYKGFYPAERTLELSKIFSQSYSEGILYTGSQAHFRSALEPLFSPGILHNSIKAGIGYSHPTLASVRDDNQIWTFSWGNRGYGGDLHSGFTFTEGTIALSALENYISTGLSLLEQVPFEAILKPEAYLSKRFYSDLYFHPSGTLFEHGITGSVISKAQSLYRLGNSTPQYKLAINNFLSETVDFFIENQTLKVLSSEADNNPDYYNFQMNKEYKMRVYLRCSKNTDELDAFKSLALVASSSLSSVLEIQGYDVTPENWIEEPGNIIAWAEYGSMFLNPKLYSQPTYGMNYKPYFSYTDAHAVITPSITANAIFGGFLNYDSSVFGSPKRKVSTPRTSYNDGAIITDKSVLNYGGLLYEHVSPPHNEGYSFVEYTFRPFNDFGAFDPADPTTRRFTLSEVMDNVTSSYFRFGERPIEEYFRFRNAGGSLGTSMSYFGLTGSNFSLTFSDTETETIRIDSAVSLKGRIRNKRVEYDVNGEVKTLTDDHRAGDRWVISPKWESPIFDFSPDVSHIASYNGTDDKRTFHYNRCRIGFADDRITGNSGTLNLTTGLWFDKGEPLAEDSGLFIEVRDSPQRYIKLEDWGTGAVNNIYGDDFGNMTASFANETALSLKDAIGFTSVSSKLGSVAKNKLIKEAVILVPFIQKDSVKSFIKITNEQMQNPSQTLQKTLDKMDEFIIPPKFNFKLYNGTTNRAKVDPIVMYIFDFEYTFSKEDLSSIWQNYAPESNLIKKSVTIEHDLKEGEILESLIDDDIQWLVFKVKQKAKWDYSQKTIDSSDDSRFKFDFASTGEFTGPEYSYNWPYDYFSVLEMAKIEASVYIESDKALNDRNLKLPTQQTQQPIDAIKKFANKSLKDRFAQKNPAPKSKTAINPEIVFKEIPSGLPDEQADSNKLTKVVSDNTNRNSGVALAPKIDVNAVLSKLGKK